jgi:hypothetical protein
VAADGIHRWVGLGVIADNLTTSQPSWTGECRVAPPATSDYDHLGHSSAADAYSASQKRHFFTEK